MHHELKILLPYYESVASGEKTFEVRLNDRGYQKGDTFTLNPIEANGTKSFSHSPISGVITYVTGYHQQPDWVVFGFKLTQ